MKKTIVAVLMGILLLTTTVPAFAFANAAPAEAAAQTVSCPNPDCPNGGVCTGTCENNGQRPQDGTGKQNGKHGISGNHGDCPNLNGSDCMGDCTSGGQRPQDGTGKQNGKQSWTEEATVETVAAGEEATEAAVEEIAEEQPASTNNCPNENCPNGGSCFGECLNDGNCDGSGEGYGNGNCDGSGEGYGNGNGTCGNEQGGVNCNGNRGGGCGRR
ncbi:MAG: hypothetical protein RSC76_01225 [Oscillospiraceae bacterium]